MEHRSEIGSWESVESEFGDKSQSCRIYRMEEELDSGGRSGRGVCVNSERSCAMKLATIVMAQVALKRMRDAKKAKAAEVASANAEDNSKMMDAIEIDVPSQAFPLPPSEPTHTPRPDLPPESNSSSIL